VLYLVALLGVGFDAMLRCAVLRDPSRDLALDGCYLDRDDSPTPRRPPIDQHQGRSSQFTSVSTS
jgi:hypothetical protein